MPALYAMFGFWSVSASHVRLEFTAPSDFRGFPCEPERFLLYVSKQTQFGKMERPIERGESTRRTDVTDIKTAVSMTIRKR